MIVPGMFVCSSFLISVCMFIVSKASFISSATVIVRAGGAIWLNPFATVLFSVCSAITVECCRFVPVLHGCVWYVCCYVRMKALCTNIHNLYTYLQTFLFTHNIPTKLSFSLYICISYNFMFLSI